MRTRLFLLIALLQVILFTGCNTKVKETVDLPFVKVDVTKNYPEKVLHLEDLAEIEILSLEMHEEFLFRGLPRLVTDDYFIIANMEGDFLIFDSKGKPLHKFNKKGNGPGEYSYLFGNLVYEQEKDELYISTSGKIQVYSLYGEYKRTLDVMKGCIITEMVNFDEEYLLCTETYTMPTTFSLVSKTTGAVVPVPIEVQNKISTSIQRQVGDMIYTHFEVANNIVRHGNGFLLTDHSVDTVYFYDKNRMLEPIFVRTPSVQVMDPVVYVNSYVETSQYLFFQTITVEFDWDTRQGFPGKNLFIDKDTKHIYEQKIVWDDYEGHEISIIPAIIDCSANPKVGLLNLRLGNLQDALEEGRLSGRLKELVSRLDEEDNDVFVLLRFK